MGASLCCEISQDPGSDSDETFPVFGNVNGGTGLSMELTGAQFAIFPALSHGRGRATAHDIGAERAETTSSKLNFSEDSDFCSRSFVWA